MTRRIWMMVAICSGLLVLAACKSGEKEKAAAKNGETQAKEEEKESGDEEETELTEKIDLPEATTVEGSNCEKPKKLTDLADHTVLSAKGGGCFLVDEVLQLRGKAKKLTVKPGVTVQFGENAGLRIRSRFASQTSPSATPVEEDFISRTR